VRQCEKLIDLDEKLIAVLKGQAQPTGAGELVRLAHLCVRKQLHANAARFFADAFAAKPGLAAIRDPGHRYDAACSAALAGRGLCRDAFQLDDKDRARCREQALDWLRADLALWNKHLESSETEDRAVVLRTLLHWQRDNDLASIRDKDAVAKLPAKEQEACKKLWADVEALLKKARQKTK
jgi:hypothetical protein